MKKDMPRDEFIRKRIARQKRIRKRRLITLFCFLIVMLLCVGAVLCLTVFFPIENIKVSGSVLYSPEDIIKNSGVETGDNLFTASEKSAEKYLKSKLPYIDSVEFKRQLPSTLTIKVKDADEYAAYSINERYYTVSKKGWVLKVSESPPENLFLITGAKAECSVGSEIVFTDTSQQDLVNSIADAVKKEDIKLDSIDITNPVQITVNVESRFEVFIGTSNSLHEKIRHLGSMIENIEPSKKGKINLSIWTNDNPQATFKEQKDE